MTRIAAAIALLLAGAAPVAAQAPPAPRAAAPADAWTRFEAEVIEAVFRAEPPFAVQQGRHDYDGRLPDWSEAGLKRAVAGYKALRTRAVGWKGLTGAQAFRRDYVIAKLDERIFWIEEADRPHRNPAFYLDNGLFPDIYTARGWGTPEARLRGYIGYAEALPTAAAQIRANLKTPMPETFVYLGKAGFQGLADFFAGDTSRQAFAAVKDAALLARLDAANKAAGAAMAGLSAWMDEAKKTQDYALGPQKFARMLAATERVDTPVAELERIGLADLRANQAALKAACASFAPGASIADCIAREEASKPEGGVVEAARAQLSGLRAFIEAKRLVTIPGPEQALVAEAPSYNRQNFAYIDIPGPYELGQPSTYYIAPPDPAWSKAVQDGYVPGKANLLFTSVHEVWPGHFLQFLHANRSTNLFGRVFVGYAYAEGYAHYAEEMMQQAGLPGGAETHIGQLSNALLRNCRYLSAIGLHTKGMTVAQSRQLFVDECYQDEGTARQQAARGTYDPAYLNYTMGKLMIRKLRDDWTAAHGGKATSLRAFHDAFLSYGGPPIPLVRGQMMGGAAKAVF